MRCGAQANDLRRQLHPAVIAVGGLVMERDANRHMDEVSRGVGARGFDGESSYLPKSSLYVGTVKHSASAVVSRVGGLTCGTVYDTWKVKSEKLYT